MASTDLATQQRLMREIDTVSRNRTQIRIWLGIVVLVLFGLVLVGGATRLTESGLSITQWKPIHGVIPPLNAAEWQEEFELYKQIPQYEQLNSDMTVEGFKTIFWWEWAHRLLARSIGLIFALPLAFFWIRGQIEPRLKLPLLGILALGRWFSGFHRLVDGFLRPCRSHRGQPVPAGHPSYHRLSDLRLLHLDRQRTGAACQ